MKWTRQRCQVGAQHLGDGGFKALMSVGDHQFDATQAAAGELAQEVGPECFGLGAADRQAENFTSSVVIDAGGDGNGDRDDPPAWRALT